jgi:hypothetical protein
MSEFRKPLNDKLMVGFVKTILPLFLRLEKLQVRPSLKCLEWLHRLRGRHCVLMVNHADRDDPTVTFELSRRANENFVYLAARELFDENLGLRGWVMQRCGAYSVIRGNTPDLASAKATIHLLTDGSRKLVEFPEGDVTGRDDVIVDLKKDGIANLLCAQDELLSQGGNVPLMILPVGIFYQVQPDSLDALAKKLIELEQMLGLPSWRKPMEERCIQLVTSLVAEQEAYYGLSIESEISLQERLQRLVEQATRKVADFIGHPDRDQKMPDLLYNARGELTRLFASERPHKNVYEQSLYLQSRRRAKLCIDELKRLQQVVILSTTLQQDPFTLETAWRVIDRVEQELTGKATAKGQRLAWIECAEPINLLEHMSAYNDDKTKAIERTEQLVRKAMDTALQRAKQIDPKKQSAEPSAVSPVLSADTTMGSDHEGFR